MKWKQVSGVVLAAATLGMGVLLQAQQPPARLPQAERRTRSRP